MIEGETALRGIVGAVDGFNDQRDHDDRQQESHCASRMLQSDVGDDIAGIPATVDDLFQ